MLSVKQTSTLAVAIVCEKCPHQRNNSTPVETRIDRADENGDVYFQPSYGEDPKHLIYFLYRHGFE